MGAGKKDTHTEAITAKLKKRLGDRGGDGGGNGLAITDGSNGDGNVQ